MEQVESARRKGLKLFGVNRIFQDVPDLELLFGTNHQFWDYYLQLGLKDHPCEKWTNSEEAAQRHGLSYIPGVDKSGVSLNPDRIHHGHSSGFCLLNLAILMGARKIVLLGFDLRFAPDYDGRQQLVGSSPRHYFSEYPPELQHWPKVSVQQGKHLELLKQYQSVARQNVAEIINCTGPNSILDCFPMSDIDAL